MYYDLGNFELVFYEILDAEGMKTSLWIFMSLFLAMACVQFLLIYLRMEKQPLKGRGIHIVLLNFFSQVVTIFVLNLRIATNRLTFSCWIYTMFQHISIHSKIII
jgi:hypothetical protein